jgi:hypothetical protein
MTDPDRGVMIGQEKTPEERFTCSHKMIVLANENGVNMMFQVCRIFLKSE